MDFSIRQLANIKLLGIENDEQSIICCAFNSFERHKCEDMTGWSKSLKNKSSLKGFLCTPT